jgi:hypothetical protein
MASLQIQKYVVSNRVKVLSVAAIVIGLITFGVGLKMQPERIWYAYLIGYFYCVSLALGGLFFTSFNHVVNAGWSVAVRRIAESFAGYLPIAVFLTIPLLFGAKNLYVWLDAKAVAEDALLSMKASYLNQGFFHIRLLLFFALWLFFAWKLVSNSLKQDETGDKNLTVQNVKYSIAFLIIFALSYSFFSIDLLMSLDAHWFSTMFGVYTFAGLFHSFLAMLALFTIGMINKGYYKGVVDENHVHDIAKFMWAFTIFFAYIGFSQYMLIWYANLPEETIFFMERAHGGWFHVSAALFFVKFLIPFLALAPRAAKRSLCHVRNVALWILGSQFLDYFWLVYPNYNHEKVVFSFWEIGVFAGFMGAFVLQAHVFLSKNNIVPVRDPRLDEALHHHV